jgi:DNA-binding MarR family transcriptional regulator
MVMTHQYTAFTKQGTRRLLAVSTLELPANPLIGALLRVPAQAVHRRIIAGLHRCGFRDLRLPHMGVLQYPGPDGYRPGELAERAGMSKQAMNQLLRSLERLGYLSRRKSAADQRARLVHFTARGRAAWREVHEILAAIEVEWRAALGEKDFDRLKALLCKVWVSDLVSRA